VGFLRRLLIRRQRRAPACSSYAFGRKLLNEVTLRLEKRGTEVSVVNKTIGYELRCAAPLPMEAEYARDLGFAAVRHLVVGGGGAVLTT
jgi:6-phosphofructokinase 1